MRRGRRKTAGRHQRRLPAPWFTRVRALLAGSLVLGVGATLTLAAWTDTEQARGTFAASTFGIVGSASSTAPAPENTFTDYSVTATPAALAFTAPFDTMSPGTTVYARFAVKTTAATNVTGKVALSAAAGAGSGLGPYLKYGVKVIPSTSTCTAASFAASSTVIVAEGSALTVAGSNPQALAAAGSSTVPYCFAVTLPTGTANAAQGLTSTATWTFTATSDS